MDRLTETREDITLLRQCFLCAEETEESDCGKCDHVVAAIEHLSKYEDTGMTPEEIMEMRAEIERIYTALA